MENKNKALEKLLDRKLHNRYLPVTAIILMGGQSKRMGQDKAYMMFSGKTFLKHQIDKMKEVGVGEIVISGACQEIIPGVRIVPDIIEKKGPLSGFHACFLIAAYTNCVVLSIDAPLVPVELLQNLIHAQLTSKSQATVVKNGDRLEPLIGVYRADLHKQIEEILHGDDYSVYALLQKIEHQEILYKGDPIFLANCNTQEDYQLVSQYSNVRRRP